VPFPNFDPVLLQIGPIAIRWYALAYVAGILLGWRYAAALVTNPRLWERRGPIATADQIGDLVVWITLGVIVAAGWATSSSTRPSSSGGIRWRS